MKRIFPLLLILGSLFVLSGCGGDDKNPVTPIDPAGAEAAAAQGDASLAAGDIAAANTYYKTALTKDPSNSHANFGAAVTEVYLLQADPDIADVLNRLGPLSRTTPPVETEQMVRARKVMGRLGMSGHSFDAISNGRLVGRILLEGVEDPPQISEIQSVIKLKVMPKLAYAEARLNVIETNSSFVYRLVPQITGEPDTLEVDLGEILALDAVVNSVQGFLGTLIAYNFDGAWEISNPESLLAPGTNFGKLHTIGINGTDELSAARGNLLLVKTRLEQMTAYIAGETDDQADDVIPAAVLTEPSFTQFWDTFNLVNTSLSSPITTEVPTYDGSSISIDIQIGKFFTNPIADWKTKLPTHTFDVNHEPVITEPVTFPDPDFNDVFPGMTNDDWRLIIGPLGPPPPPSAS